jgi:hypothetical protein
VRAVCCCVQVRHHQCGASTSNCLSHCSWPPSVLCKPFYSDEHMRTYHCQALQTLRMYWFTACNVDLVDRSACVLCEVHQWRQYSHLLLATERVVKNVVCRSTHTHIPLPCRLYCSQLHKRVTSNCKKMSRPRSPLHCTLTLEHHCMHP